MPVSYTEEQEAVRDMRELDDLLGDIDFGRCEGVRLRSLNHTSWSNDVEITLMYTDHITKLIELAKKLSTHCESLLEVVEEANDELESRDE
jgi:hypothetical protein